METLTKSRTQTLGIKSLKRDPIHRQLYQILREPIMSGDYGPGAKLPTEAQLTKLYNVSRITVRRALQELASEGLIEARKSQGTFVLEGADIRAKHRYIFIHDKYSPVAYPYLQFILQGIQSCSENIKFRLEMIARDVSNNAIETDAAFSGFIQSADFNGIIALPGYLTNSELRLLEKLSVPVVFIGHAYNNMVLGAKMTQIECDTKDVLMLLLSHLSQNGKKNIGYIGKPVSDYRPHLELITNIFREIGVDFNPDFYQTSDYGINSATQACEKLLKRHPDIDAVICTDDLQAIGALQYLRSSGKRVPQDVAVSGVGNFLDKNSHFDITTVDNRVREQGKMAVKCLEDFIASRPVDKHIKLEPLLVRRKTT